jgi:hypothetical protein
MDRECNTHEEKKIACRFLVGNRGRRRSEGRLRRRREVNIKMDLEEIEWSNLPQDTNQWRALVYTVMNFRVP